MTLTLPDDPSLGQFTSAELRIELACALFARGKIGKARAAALAGVDLIAFQRALGEREVESYTAAMLESDLCNLRKLFSVA